MPVCRSVPLIIMQIQPHSFVCKLVHPFILWCHLCEPVARLARWAILLVWLLICAQISVPQLFIVTALHKNVSRTVHQIILGTQLIVNACRLVPPLHSPSLQHWPALQSAPQHLQLLLTKFQDNVSRIVQLVCMQTQLLRLAYLLALVAIMQMLLHVPALHSALLITSEMPAQINV